MKLLRTFACLFALVVLTAAPLSAQRSVDKVRLTETFSLLNGRLKMLFPEGSIWANEKPTFFNPADVNLTEYAVSVLCPEFYPSRSNYFQVWMDVQDLFRCCTRDEFYAFAKRQNTHIIDSMSEEMFTTAGLQCLIMKHVRPPEPNTIKVLNQIVVRTPDSCVYLITTILHQPYGYHKVDVKDFFLAQTYALRIFETITAGDRKTDFKSHEKSFSFPGSAVRIHYHVPAGFTSVTIDNNRGKSLYFSNYLRDTSQDNVTLSVFFESGKNEDDEFPSSRFFWLQKYGDEHGHYSFKQDLKDSSAFMNKPFEWSVYQDSRGKYLFGAMLENVEGRKFVLEAWLNSKEELSQINEILQSFQVQK